MRPRLENLIGELFRFGVVGIIATTVYLALYAGLIEFAGVAPLVSNCIGSAVGVAVSFAGHNWWTFQSGTAHRHLGNTGIRFLLVNLIGFAESSVIVFVITGPLAARYEYSIIAILAVVPLSQYLLNKFWTFRDRQGWATQP